jgi:hypothetical protein
MFWGDEVDPQLRRYGRNLRDSYSTFIQTGKMPDFKVSDRLKNLPKIIYIFRRQNFALKQRKKFVEIIYF